MISLCILVPIVVISFLASAWVIARAAKAVGSPKGRLWVGVRAVLVITAVNLLITVFTSIIPMQHLPSVIFWGIVALMAQIYLIFICLRQTFALMWKQTFAPFGAFIGMSVLQIALALLVIRPFLVHAFTVPTESMSPTIAPGDRFLVNKILHPRRLDVVVYHNEDDPQSDLYCKRLIGLPGERLRFENGGIYVNDQPVELPAVLAGKVHAMPQPGRETRYYDGNTITLGNDEYFLIGDNLTISLDSRLLGPSHASAIVGVVDVIYWPPRRIRLLR